jgi:DNA-directed RNA polymerase specialized sigma24 family protein
VGRDIGTDNSLALVSLPAQPSGLAGFEDRFVELFEVAYRVAYRILGHREEARDVAQEALARAQLRWERLADAPHGWVAKVAANLAIAVWRKERRRRAAHGSMVGAGPDPWALERLDLVKALRRLPRRQRQVVILRYLADQPEASVARLLGCSIGSVKTHASRGLRAMQVELEGP